MKLLSRAAAAVAVLGLVGQASASAARHRGHGQRHLLAENATASQVIELSSIDTSIFTPEMLMAMGPGPKKYVECKSISGPTVNSEESFILIAISKCFTKEEIDAVAKWFGQLDFNHLDYFAENQNTKLKLHTKLVPGDCSELIVEPEKEGGGANPTLLADGTNYMLHNEVLPGESAERLSAFAKFSRVLDAADDGGGGKGLINPDDVDFKIEDDYIGVVSFVNNGGSLDYVEEHVRSGHTAFALTFKICVGDKCNILAACKGKMTCVDISYVGEIFMYNPYSIKHSLMCTDLVGSVPVTFVDNTGCRKCFCTCPVGSRLVTDKGVKSCTPIKPGDHKCSWQTRTDAGGYTIQLSKSTAPKTCAINNVVGKGVDVPFPSDNYVADVRLNAGDPTPTSPNPFVMLEANLYGHPSGELFSKKYPWTAYQGEPEKYVNDITFSSYGRYLLTLTAWDYHRDATCQGCLVIVDRFRPQATSKCPSGLEEHDIKQIEGIPTAELTPKNLKEIKDVVEDFYEYQSEAVNDKCSIAGRCDDEHCERRDFFEHKFSKLAYSSGKECFDKDDIYQDLLKMAKSKANPLASDRGVADQEASVPYGQCSRCCKYSVKLKEKWTDYSCSNKNPEEVCDGDSDQKCDVSQCVVLEGHTMVTTSAEVRKSVKDESAKVLAAMHLPDPNDETHIHHALSCMKFGENSAGCKYQTTIEALIDTDAEFAIPAPKSADADDYVFWRYRIGGGKWSLLETKSVETFKDPQTTVHLQAWTQCGIVKEYYFSIMLHIHSDIKVCDVFGTMWYQTLETKLDKPTLSDFCTLPGSDFAELTFDYHPNVGLQFASEELQATIKKVTCTINYQDRTSVEIVNHDTAPYEIVERFAVEMVNKAMTEKITTINVNCVFNYKHYDGSDVDPMTCTKAYTITDCNGPAIDLHYAREQYEVCKAAENAEKAGPFEACAGDIIYSLPGMTKKTSTPRQCCQGAEDAKAECVSIFDADYPDESESIKRCVPAYKEQDLFKWEYKTYSRKFVVAGQKLLAAAGQRLLGENAGASAILVASAMVAVVALVTVRSRRREASHNAAVEDAYYPLLH